MPKRFTDVHHIHFSSCLSNGAGGQFDRWVSNAAVMPDSWIDHWNMSNDIGYYMVKNGFSLEIIQHIQAVFSFFSRFEKFLLDRFQ